MNNETYFLKEITESDIAHIYKGLSNPEITKYYDVHFSSLEETKVQMNWYKELIDTETGKWWGIYTKETERFCGAGGFNDVDKTHKKAEIGFWLLKEYWGKEILKKVMSKLFKIGFTQLNLNRITGYVVSDNKKCKQALKKVDFSFEGTLKEFEIKNGKKINVDVYTILKSEWERNASK